MTGWRVRAGKTPSIRFGLGIPTRFPSLHRVVSAPPGEGRGPGMRSGRDKGSRSLGRENCNARRPPGQGAASRPAEHHGVHLEARPGGRRQACRARPPCLPPIEPAGPGPGRSSSARRSPATGCRASRTCSRRQVARRTGPDGMRPARASRWRTPCGFLAASRRGAGPHGLPFATRFRGDRSSARGLPATIGGDEGPVAFVSNPSTSQAHAFARRRRNNAARRDPSRRDVLQDPGPAPSTSRTCGFSRRLRPPR